MFMREELKRMAEKQSQETGQKRHYCARCGRTCVGVMVLWSDLEGRIFRFHRGCGRKAQKERDLEAMERADCLMQKGQERG